MPTYVDFNPAKPDTSTDNMATTSSHVRANFEALVDMIMMGTAKDWDGTKIIGGGSEAEPDAVEYDDGGTNRLKFAFTWSSGKVTVITVTFSVNSGGSYDPVGTITITYSGNYYSSHAWS